MITPIWSSQQSIVQMLIYSCNVAHFGIECAFSEKYGQYLVSYLYSVYMYDSNIQSMKMIKILKMQGVTKVS